MSITDQELRDLVANLAISQAKTDAQIAKTDAKFKTMQKMLDGISGNQGSVAEEFFYNSLKSKPVLGNIQFDRVTPQLIVGRKGKQNEYDVVLVNGASVGIVEVKYKAHVNDLEQVHAKVQRFRTDCPEFKDFAIYGGIAGLSVPHAVSEAAKVQGLFVLTRKGVALDVQTEGMREF